MIGEFAVVDKSLYHAAYFNVSCNAFFQLSLWKKHFLWRWYCGKRQIEMLYCGLYSYQQRVCIITLFPNIFLYCFYMFRKIAQIFERKVWHLQVALLHKAAHAFLNLSLWFWLLKNLDRDFFCYLWCCGKKNIYILMWLSMVRTLINNNTFHHSGHNTVHNILITVMTCIIASKSTNHAKPHSSWEI